MVQFPDDSAFQRTPDNSEPILGGSVGLNRILLMLRSTATQTNRIPWNTVLINAFTVFRNIYTKDASIAVLTEKFRQDIDLFRLYFTAYLTSHASVHTILPIVVYIPCYDYFLADILRKTSPTNIVVLETFNAFCRSFTSREINYGMTEATSLWGVRVGTKTMLPHISLAHWLQDSAFSNRAFGYRPGCPVMLITHCPIDLHIYRRIPDVRLVESYQGTIRPPQEFGRKLSSGSDQIPFIAATHRALGDNVHIAPLATNKQRTILLDTAVSDKWISKPTEFVTKNVAQILGTSVSELLKLRV